MTITFSFWWLPALFTVVGLGLFVLLLGRTGDFDPVHPLLAVFALFSGCAIAVALIVGRWLA